MVYIHSKSALPCSGWNSFPHIDGDFINVPVQLCQPSIWRKIPPIVYCIYTSANERFWRQGMYRCSKHGRRNACPQISLIKRIIRLNNRNVVFAHHYTPSKCENTERPITFDNLTGTAFPICLMLSVHEATKRYVSGKVWIRALSLTV